MSLIKRLEEANVDKRSSKLNDKEVDPYFDLKIKIQNKVIEELDIDFNDISEQNEELKKSINFIITKNIEQESLNMTNNQKKKIKEELLDEIIGFGPITGLLSDSEITEIMVNGPEQVYIEKKGKLQLTDAK
jgi:pilus assembly protein CpaF